MKIRNRISVLVFVLILTLIPAFFFQDQGKNVALWASGVVFCLTTIPVIVAYLREPWLTILRIGIPLLFFIFIIGVLGADTNPSGPFGSLGVSLIAMSLITSIGTFFIFYGIGKHAVKLDMAQKV